MKTNTFIWGIIVGLVATVTMHDIRIKRLEDERVRVDRAFRYISELRAEVDSLKHLTNGMK